MLRHSQVLCCATQMDCLVKHLNILDEPADVLVCSANVSLNLSGGVGAELLMRYGVELQRKLHEQIAARVPRAGRQGEIFVTRPKNTPYLAVLHAVGVDAWYHVPEEVARELIAAALAVAAGLGAKTIALTALGTGYGDLSLAGLARAVVKATGSKIPPIQTVSICLPDAERATELRELIQRNRNPVSN